MPAIAEILKKSLEEREGLSLPAAEDLNGVVATLSTAVKDASAGQLRVILDPIKPKEAHGPTFALLLKTPSDEKFLRVIALTETGYPAQVWNSFAGWDTSDPRSALSLPDAESLRKHLIGLVEGPQAELVRLLADELPSLPQAARPESNVAKANRVRSAKQVIDAALRDNLWWEQLCFGLVVLLVLSGLGVIATGIILGRDLLALGGTGLTGLFWPALMFARRMRTENIRIRMLKLPLSQATSAAEAQAIIANALRPSNPVPQAGRGPAP